MVMLSERARAAIDATSSSSFACDLKKWLQIMEAYENGGHAYHATMPTDALMRLRETMIETQSYGFAKVRAEQEALGRKVRALFESRGIAIAEWLEAVGHFGFLQDVAEEKDVVGFIVDSNDQRLRHGSHGSIYVRCRLQYKQRPIGESLFLS
jgi:aspartate aminotransferase-like enzyme